MSRTYTIIGNGGHAKTIKRYMVDEFVQMIEVFPGNELRHKYTYTILGFRDRLARERLVEELDTEWFSVADVDDIKSSNSSCGVGTFIAKGVTINRDCEIGNHCIINHGAIIEHDCVIEDFAQIAPGAILCGNVHIGRGASIGAGAIICEGAKIGHHATIGAGTVILPKSTANPFTVIVGNQARSVGIKTMETLP